MLNVTDVSDLKLNICVLSILYYIDLNLFTDMDITMRTNDCTGTLEVPTLSQYFARINGF